MSKMTPLFLLSTCLLLAGPAQAGSADAGKTKAADICVDCHGLDGKEDKEFPIAGMSVEDFTKAMKEYQSGVRTKSKKMTKAAGKVNDEDIADLAAHYSAQPK